MKLHDFDTKSEKVYPVDAIEDDENRKRGKYLSAPRSVKDLLEQEGATLQQYVKNSWLDLSNLQLTSLEGLPSRVKWSLNISNNMLTSFDHLPSNLQGSIQARNNSIKSLQNIHHHLKEMGRNQFISLSLDVVKSDVLGLLKIKGLKVIVDPDIDRQGTVLYPKWARIMNEHLAHEDHAENNEVLYSCQEALLALEDGEPFAKM